MLSFSCSPARAARGSIQIAGHGWASYKVNCMTLGVSRPRAQAKSTEPAGGELLLAPARLSRDSALRAAMTAAFIRKSFRLSSAARHQLPTF